MEINQNCNLKIYGNLLCFQRYKKSEVTQRNNMKFDSCFMWSKKDIDDETDNRFGWHLKTELY